MNNKVSVVVVEGKEYDYTLTEKKDGIVHVECPAAALTQDFLGKDVEALLIDLPNLIIDEKECDDKVVLS